MSEIAPETEAKTTFGARLVSAIAERGSLCVGIDPHPGLLAAWGLSVDVAGLERFALTAIDAIGPEVAVVKPQSAFFEVFGPPGLAILERVQKRAREYGALVLLDVKRGDIGSTMSAYAEAYLGENAVLGADAITVSPYLGFGALAPALSAAQAQGKGIFVLARTSNSDGHDLQNAVMPTGKTVAQSIVDDTALLNREARPLGSVGVVVGATVSPHDLELGELNGPILAPGFGAQGATVENLRQVFGADLRHVLPSSSREILSCGPTGVALRDAVRRTQELLVDLSVGPGEK